MIWRDATALIVLSMVSLGAFLAKPVHLDDPLFIWTARQIQEHPADFYGFDVNWYGRDQSMAEVNQNPPLVAYYIAIVASLIGYGEVGLHAAFLLPNLALVIGAYGVARRFCECPLLAATVTLFTPLVLVSCSTLMCDSSMLALWCWAVVCWLRGLETRRLRWYLAAGLLIALAALTKYFGLALIPLLGIYAVVRTRRLGGWSLGLLVPIVVMAAYEMWTARLYGHGLLLNAFRYAASEWGGFHFGITQQTLLGVVFLGGCLLPVAFFAPWTWPKEALIGAAVLAASAGLVLFSIDAFLGVNMRREGFERIGFVLMVVACLAAGAHVVALAACDLWQRRDANALFLAAWVAGTFVFAAYLNWTLNARTLLPLAPAVGILLARRLEAMKSEGGATRSSWLALPLLLAFALSMIVTWADYGFASAARLAAQDVAREFAGNRLRFQGHWGFQYYLQQQHAIPVGSAPTTLEPGDIVIVPLMNTNVAPLPSQGVQLVTTMRFAANRYATTYSPEQAACFYLGQRAFPLPYAFGSAPAPYNVFRVKRPIQAQPPSQ